MGGRGLAENHSGGPPTSVSHEGSTSAIGRIGAGAQAAAAAPPTVAGAGQAGSAETCSAQWSGWAGVTASTSLYAFDGYVWLRDGVPIAGQTGQTYTPTAADGGHQLACRITGTYPLPFFVTSVATSGAITVRPAAAPSLAPSPPTLSLLELSPRTFALTGREVNGRCIKASSTNEGKPSCEVPIKLKIAYRLSSSAMVTLTLDRNTTGRKVGANCVKQTSKNMKHKRCALVMPVRYKLVLTGKAGANSNTFTVRIGGHSLGPGTYELIATPSGGKPRTTAFTITP